MDNWNKQAIWLKSNLVQKGFDQINTNKRNNLYIR